MNDLAENKHKLYIPKRRKLNTISHIHKTFFEEGHESDVKIVAVNREWNLHRNFLSQSPYFKSMFSGSWVEKKLKEIDLRIEDENITPEALHKVFESLYSDEIQVEPTETVPILACATFLQLDDLIDHCAEVMKVCINKDTAVRFFEVAERYSIEEVKNVAFDWLCRNVWNILKDYAFPHLLNMINEDLMKKLLTSSDLCVHEERHVFEILISWIYLKENSSEFFKENSSEFDESFSWDDVYDNSLLYYQVRYAKGKPFLETDSGIPYQSLFRTIRINSLILNEVYFEDIEKDNIIPAEWYMPVIKAKWYNILSIHKGSDKGPNSVSEEVFDRECVRLGECIPSEGYRWSYRHFDFGFGLGFCNENGSFKIKRDISSDNSVCPASSNRGKRYLMYRLSLFSEDDDGRVLSKAETGIQTVSMAPNDEIEVLSFNPLKDSVLRYRINFLLTTP